MVQKYTIRPATDDDAHNIDLFLNSGIRYHRHLDWRKPTEWLGKSPFLIQVAPDHSVSAILNCVSEIKDVFWIRLFACIEPQKETFFWESLFTSALGIITKLSPHPIIASLSYQKWFSELLITNGWYEKQKVIQFQWESNKGKLKNSFGLNSSIRLMTIDDLKEVSAIDDICFQSIWQQSKKAVEYAYKQSAYATVFQKNNSIVGFQMSTFEKEKAHLARIAVLPEFQRHHIGQQLVSNTLQFFSLKKVNKISVNTQETNTSSIALYKKLNFRKTKGAFPIFFYD